MAVSHASPSTIQLLEVVLKHFTSNILYALYMEFSRSMKESVTHYYDFVNGYGATYT